MHFTGTKVKKKANIRYRYNQVQNLTRSTIWESDKTTRKHYTQESQKISPLSPLTAGGHKAARNRQDSVKKINMKRK